VPEKRDDGQREKIENKRKEGDCPRIYPPQDSLLVLYTLPEGGFSSSLATLLALSSLKRGGGVIDKV
jgi:hypothetical protein